LVIIAVLSFGYSLYKYNKASKLTMAQRDFSDCLEEFNKAINLSKDEKKSEEEVKSNWEEVLDTFKDSYKKHSKTELGPYFLAFEAEALLQQNEKEKALKVLQDAVNKMDKKSPFYFLYKTKLALIELDGDKKEEALVELESLAKNKSNENRDLALYYLGEYYYLKDSKKTIEYWETLQEFPKEGLAASPWTRLADLKLKFIK
jgi:predicted Zn-dependent protease